MLPMRHLGHCRALSRHLSQTKKPQLWHGNADSLETTRAQVEQRAGESSKSASNGCMCGIVTVRFSCVISAERSVIPFGV